MINLKKFFQSNPYLLPVTKPEKEMLEYFAAHRSEFEHWISLHRHPKISFRFYFPAAIDFYFEDAKLFTAFFKKGLSYEPVLHELKMSEANFSTIKASSWSPFAEVIMNFLTTMEENNKFVYVQKTKSLQEYVSRCQHASPAA